MKKIIQYSLWALIASSLTAANATDYSKQSDQHQQSKVSLHKSEESIALAYKEIFHKDNDILLQNIQNPDNQEKVRIISDFIKSATHSAVIPHWIRTSENTKLLELFYAAQSFSNNRVINDTEELKQISSHTLSLLVKILNHTMTKDEIQKTFSPSWLFFAVYSEDDNVDNIEICSLF